MKSHLLFRHSLAVCLLVFSVSRVGAETIVPESRIVGVTVYQSGAVVRREASLTLPTGGHEVVFAGLPDGLDANLLQLSGSGTAEATILEVRSAPAQMEAPANPRLRELRDQTRALENEMRVIKDRGSLFAQQRDFLERIKIAVTTPPEKEGASLPSTGDWDELIDFYAKRQETLASDVRALELENHDLEERMAAIARQIETLQAPAQRSVQNVTVRCDVSREGTLKLSLSYSLDDAEWHPTYDVRVSSTEKTMALAYGAIVRQSTGEDWKGVELRLSTADPYGANVPPALSTWFLKEKPDKIKTLVGRDQEATLLTYATNSEVGNVLGNFAGVGSNLSGNDVVEVINAAGSSTASVAASLTSAVFTIPYAAEVPADNAPHKLSVGSSTLTGRINHLALPKLRENAFLRALVDNTSEFPLVEGDLHLFLDGNYVASSDIGTVMPGGQFILHLGVDNGISVKRRLINRNTENIGVVGRKARITYDAVITVENHHPTAESIVVKDQLPISQHEKIVVTMIEPAKGTTRNTDDGTINWDLELKPGERRELSLKFSVEFPSEFPVIGLE